MNQNLLIIFFITIFLNTNLYSQITDNQIQYKRSSLHLGIVNSGIADKSEYVLQAYDKYPFPDKYNNHIVDVPVFTPDNYELTEEERVLHNVQDEEINAEADEYLKEATSGFIDNKSGRENMIIHVKLDKYFNETKLANKLVAKWFNYSKEDNKFDMSLIQERGNYNATEMEVNIAKNQARGLASIADAGELLINNTFVTYTKLAFYKNEPVARAVRDFAVKQADKISNEFTKDLAVTFAEQTYNATKEGYTAVSIIWLYQLDWNDSVAAVFYTDIWKNPQLLETTDIFKLKLLGVESSKSHVIFTVEETEQQVIERVVIRNIDNSFSKLQKKYEVFMPKVPITSIDPIRAQIGLKEGITKNSRFEVLEMIVDPETERTSFKQVAVIKPKEDCIWDNRYKLTDELISEEAKNIPKYTEFRGRSSKIYPGMLIKQIK
ncbi:MAG: hypothetical protein ACOXZ9_07215 [Bacteroidales bacterium]|jgi:hypothetical protein